MSTGPVSGRSTREIYDQARRQTENSDVSRTYDNTWSGERQSETPVWQPEGGGRELFSHSTGYSTGAGVGSVGTSGTGPGGIEYNASASGPQFSFDANADFSVSTSGIDVKVDLNLEGTLASAEAGASRTFEFEVAGEKFEVTLSLEAVAQLGGEANLTLDLHIGPDGVRLNASGDGFAGAAASLTGSISVSSEKSGVIAEGAITLSAYAGVAASGHANLSLSGGNIAFDVGGSVSVGLGVGVDVSGSVNTGALLDSLEKIALPEWAEGPVDGVQDFVGDVAGTLGDAAGTAGNWLKENVFSGW